MKALVIADVHIDDFANYNYSHRSRLQQFDLLADRLIELVRLYGCTEIWIAGDLINRPSCRPYVLHAANKFIRKISSAVSAVRYILGNHDIDSKSKDLTAHDSLITIFDQENLIYMDQKTLCIDGIKFGFMNWRPDQDLTWLGEDHLDVLIGHYTKSELFGQDIDESKFDLMIHGDIHNSQVIGKFVSICNPIQHDMSSESSGKAVIIDTNEGKLKWEHIELDPDHTRFLRLSYVDDPALEGFRSPIQYNIFKPKLSTEQVCEEERSIEWTEVDELINKVCSDNNLLDIHSKVESECDEFTEIDFNFQVTYLKIHGYRSIEDMELRFDRGDRVALLGSNGSGKSSIIRALQAAFLKNSELKYEQSTFTDEVYIIVKLTYQNKVYEIRKGSSWGLLIDGVEQPYRGIREFEADLLVKLPFLNYLDLIFLNSNISNLATQFNSFRRIELISKFYRLDRISAFNSTAQRLWNETNSMKSQIDTDRSVSLGIKQHINTRLMELDSYKDKDTSVYESKLADLNESLQKSHKRKTWESELSAQLSLLSSVESTLNSVKSKLTFDYDSGVNDLKELESKSTSINEAYELTYNKSIEFESVLKELIELEKSGKQISDKLDALYKGICPECGATLASTKSSKLVESYNNELSELRARWVELDEKLNLHPLGRESKDHYVKVLSELKLAHKEVKDAIELLDNKLRNHSSNKVLYDNELKRFNQVQSIIDELKSNEPEKIQISASEITEQTSELISTINKIKEYQSIQSELADLNKTIEDYDNQIRDLVQLLDKYNLYCDITSLAGEIMVQILMRLSKRFSTPDVKYEVEAGTYRGSKYVNFNSYYLSKGTYRVYESCSDGQKTLCDLDFLEKLFSVNIGLLTLDEYLKHLDDVNFSKVCDILTRINVNTIILSTHDSNLTAYTRRILLNLDPSGKTIAEVV